MYSISEVIVLFPTLIGMIAFGFLLSHFVLKDKSDKVKNIPFLCISSILLILEVIKQVRLIIIDDWSWWSFPLHFCSLFMLWFSLDSFGKGKVKKFGQTLSFVSCVWFILLFYIGPQGIIGDACKNVFASFSTFHTFFYHQFIVLYFIFMVCLRTYKCDLKRDIIYSIIAYTIFAVCAITLGNITQTNYTNVLHSNIPFMQALLDKCGYVIYLIVFYIAGIGLPSLVVFITHLIQNKGVKKNDSNQ